MPFIVLFFALFMWIAPAAAAGWDPATEEGDVAKLIARSRAAIDDFKKADPTLERFFREAHGYAVLPHVTKGAVGVGGARGKGVVFTGGKPALKVYLTQFTVGAQLGGKSFAQIIFFRDRTAYDAFVNDEFEFSAQARANWAKDSAGETAAYDEGIAVFVREKGGAMAEASLGGQRYKIRELK